MHWRKSQLYPCINRTCSRVSVLRHILLILMSRMIGFVKNWAPRVGQFGNASTREEIETTFMKSFQESAKAYFEAADKFPEDDEAHVCKPPLSPFRSVHTYMRPRSLTLTSSHQGTLTVVSTSTGVPVSRSKSPFPSWNVFAKPTTRCVRRRYGRTRRWVCKGGIKRCRG